MGSWQQASLEGGLDGEHPLLVRSGWILPLWRPAGLPWASQPSSPLPTICLCLCSPMCVHASTHTHTARCGHVETRTVRAGGLQGEGTVFSTVISALEFSPWLLLLINGPCVTPSPGPHTWGSDFTFLILASGPGQEGAESPGAVGGGSPAGQEGGSQGLASSCPSAPSPPALRPGPRGPW